MVVTENSYVPVYQASCTSNTRPRTCIRGVELVEKVIQAALPCSRKNVQTWTATKAATAAISERSPQTMLLPLASLNLRKYKHCFKFGNGGSFCIKVNIDKTNMLLNLIELGWVSELHVQTLHPQEHLSRSASGLSSALDPVIRFTATNRTKSAIWCIAYPRRKQIRASM